MGKSNHKLTDEEKRELDIIAKHLIDYIDGQCSDQIGSVIDPYSIETGDFDNNKFTAMVWYIGDKLSCY